ncbi:MAG: DUF1059 domain-containing protein [Actinobacteria bacterium]|nr:DUF1059 domain-containing protein [Actinomycetota bacterium]
MSGYSIECPCGVVFRSGDEESIVAEARQHAHEVHDLDLDDGQARAMVQPS